MKHNKLCMMICGVADCLWRMKIWCMLLKRRLEKMCNSPLHHFPCIFFKFRCQLLSKLCLINLSFWNCVHNGCWRFFTEEHKLEQQARTLDYLTQYSEEEKNSLSHVVTGNETLVSHEAPKSKQHSMEWRHTSSPTKMKFKQTTSTRKFTCTIFWDRKVVLPVDFLPQGSAMNAGVCCNTLQKFHCVVHNKLCVMFSWGVVMIHDNTRPHTAMENVITTFCWEQFDHPPYGPHLAPSDFHLLLHLKFFLAGRWFHDDSEVKEIVTTCFA